MSKNEKRHEIRELILKTIQDSEPKPNDYPPKPNLTVSHVLNEVQKRSPNIQYNDDLQKAVLYQWNELFRTGYLGWGINLSNPVPGQFFHVTEQGRRTLERLSRDPGNPSGYLAHVRAIAKLNPIAESYLVEAVHCFVGDLHKAAAVMIGASAESLVLDLRDATVAKLTQLGRPPSPKLSDWRIKVVLDHLHGFLEHQKSAFQESLRGEYEGYWSAFTHQIRTVRNDAGHPISVEPVTNDTVHASFLLFPELAKLSTKLKDWVMNELK